MNDRQLGERHHCECSQHVKPGQGAITAQMEVNATHSSCCAQQSALACHIAALAQIALCQLQPDTEQHANTSVDSPAADDALACMSLKMNLSMLCTLVAAGNTAHACNECCTTAKCHSTPGELPEVAEVHPVYR